MLFRIFWYILQHGGLRFGAFDRKDLPCGFYLLEESELEIRCSVSVEGNKTNTHTHRDFASVEGAA